MHWQGTVILCVCIYLSLLLFLTTSHCLNIELLLIFVNVMFFIIFLDNCNSPFLPLSIYCLVKLNHISLSTSNSLVQLTVPSQHLSFRQKYNTTTIYFKSKTWILKTKVCHSKILNMAFSSDRLVNCCVKCILLRFTSINTIRSTSEKKIEIGIHVVLSNSCYTFTFSFVNVKKKNLAPTGFEIIWSCHLSCSEWICIKSLRWTSIVACKCLESSPLPNQS